MPATRREKGHPLDSVAPENFARPSSVIDRDDGEPNRPSDAPEKQPAPRFGWEAMEQDSPEEDFLGESKMPGSEQGEPVFNDSLITNNGFERSD